MRPFTLFILLYKTALAVIIVHHWVRQLGNVDLIIELLRCSIENCWSGGALPPKFPGWRRATRVEAPVPSPAKEAAMELRTKRLNVLAAIVSFAFLTAVVFGMF